MLSTKLLRDEQEMRYYEDVNATMLCESIKSTWYEVVADKIAEIKENANMKDRAKFVEILDTDGNTCIQIVNGMIDNIESLVHNYLQIPNNVVIPRDKMYIASEDLASLEAEVANLKLELNRHKIYTALLNQRLEEMKIAEKLACKIKTVFIEQLEKISEKTDTLNQLMALKGAAKSGEDITENLLALEKIVNSLQRIAEN